MSASVMLSSPDLQAKLQLDEIATSFGQRQPSDQREKDLIETIKVPLGNNLRRLGNVLPKPCYPDVRPNSPSSWTVAEQEKQRQYAAPAPAPPPVASTYIPSKIAESNRSDATGNGVGASYAPRPIPRMPLASIPEAVNNYNNQPSRAMYSNVSNAPQAPQKVSYVVQARPPQIRRYPAPQSYLPTAVPVMSQVRQNIVIFNFSTFT